MSLETPKSVQALQMALHAKAKGSATTRFYSLYDKVVRMDVLLHAYAQCRSNGGAAGVDGQTFEAIEASGVGSWIAELAKSPVGSVSGCVTSSSSGVGGRNGSPTNTSNANSAWSG